MAAVFAVASVVASSYPSRAVHAQTSHIEAAVRASQARAAARRGDLNEAARLFRASIAMNELPAVLREYAQLLEQQGDLRAAAGAWGRVAALAPRPEDRDAAMARREFLRRTASLLRVRVLPSLAAREARVWFDRDRPRHVPVGGAESFVEGGAHRVRVESPGYVPFETMVTTAYGEPADMVARMTPAPDAGVPQAPSDSANPAPAPASRDAAVSVTSDRR